MTTTKRIQELNDAFRTTMSLSLGRIVITPMTGGLEDRERQQLFQSIMAFDAFDTGNDPYREHDFGSITLGDDTYFWKIDYYDASCESGSEDPADPDKTCRVMTIMHSSEY